MTARVSFRQRGEGASDAEPHDVLVDCRELCAFWFPKESVRDAVDSHSPAQLVNAGEPLLDPQRVRGEQVRRSLSEPEVREREDARFEIQKAIDRCSRGCWIEPRGYGERKIRRHAMVACRVAEEERRRGGFKGTDVVGRVPGSCQDDEPGL